MLWMYCLRSRKSSAPRASGKGGVPPPGISPVTCARAAMDPAKPAAAAPKRDRRLNSFAMDHLLRACRWGRWRQLLRQRGLGSDDARQRGVCAFFILVRSPDADGADHLIVDHDGKAAGRRKHADAGPAQLQ